ncbi:YicC/YloC family endoribonuclease [Gemmatimonadota bacterium]
MPRSMTGYGLATGAANGGKVQVEIRTVNHRHFTTNLKLTSPLHSLEGEVRKALHERIHRGHVTTSARWLEEPERPTVPKVDLTRAREVTEALRELKSELDLPGEIDLSFVVRQPEVFTIVSGEAPTADEVAFLAVVNQALDGVLATRDREGQSLTGDLKKQLEELASLLAAVEERAPERITNERNRLHAAVGELLEGRPIDDDRLSLEIAILADKLDVTEETVRLRAHIDACREVLEKSGPVGRELTFLGQEMLREINTIGSKANDATIAQTVIDMKCVLEKYREQVENIE